MKELVAFGAIALIVTILSLTMFLYGGALGVKHGREATQRQAIEHGAAEWTIDSETGEKSFKWKERTP